LKLCILERFLRVAKVGGFNDSLLLIEGFFVNSSFWTRLQPYRPIRLPPNRKKKKSCGITVPFYVRSKQN